MQGTSTFKHLEDTNQSTSFSVHGILSVSLEEICCCVGFTSFVSSDGQAMVKITLKSLDDKVFEVDAVEPPPVLLSLREEHHCNLSCGYC
ncbi:hypothetical protein MUK42_33913 [Musa troglodytarum]|uniref:Uncharacterized protein n=1 Tax=Musa troglodytarum TaxID=320322 RepID=A0A9E7ECN0_9LILI|nr:hypothetical protein MUK42_33913 [Musa troglodytarum]